MPPKSGFLFSLCVYFNNATGLDSTKLDGVTGPLVQAVASAENRAGLGSSFPVLMDARESGQGSVPGGHWETR